MGEQPFTAAREQAEQIVFMDQLTSSEMYLHDDQSLSPVLNEISLSIRQGETWGVNGSSLLQIKLLLEIMANIKPYHSGRCVLIEKGMMRRKRVVLPHVFYIGSPAMVYNNMNLLEYLMFATAKQKWETVERQEWIFEYVISIGLGNISLTPLRLLSREQKAVVILLAAALSDSQLIVFNLPDYRFDQVLCGAVAKIARLIAEKGKTLVIGTQECGLIEKCCTHIAFLIGGRLAFQGPLRRFKETYDQIVLTVWDKDAAKIAARLKKKLPRFQYSVKDGMLTVSSGEAKRNTPKRLYDEIIKAGFSPEKVAINLKTVANACEGIKSKHDLQE